MPGPQGRSDGKEIEIIDGGDLYESRLFLASRHCSNAEPSMSVERLNLSVPIGRQTKLKLEAARKVCLGSSVPIGTTMKGMAFPLLKLIRVGFLARNRLQVESDRLKVST